MKGFKVKKIFIILSVLFIITTLGIANSYKPTKSIEPVRGSAVIQKVFIEAKPGQNSVRRCESATIKHSFGYVPDVTGMFNGGVSLPHHYQDNDFKQDVNYYATDKDVTFTNCIDYSAGYGSNLNSPSITINYTLS